jgi:hypothetical protein
MFIPTPDASKVIDDYAVFYDENWEMPESYVEFTEPVCHV